MYQYTAQSGWQEWLEAAVCRELTSSLAYEIADAGA
jgi:hypothetical protein